MIYVLVEKTASVEDVIAEIKLRYFNQETNLRMIAFDNKDSASSILESIKESNPDYNKNLVLKAINISIS